MSEHATGAPRAAWLPEVLGPILSHCVTGGAGTAQHPTSPTLTCCVQQVRLPTHPAMARYCELPHEDRFRSERQRESHDMRAAKRSAALQQTRDTDTIRTGA